MYCKFCGKPIAAADQVCPDCGKAQHDPLMPPPGLKRRQFYKKHFRHRAALRTAAILCYISAALTLLLGLKQHVGIWSLIEVVILLFLGGFMHLTRSRVCAVMLSLYAVLCAVSAFNGGYPEWMALGTLLLVVLAAVFGLLGTFCFARDWKQYCKACGKVR